MGFIIKARSHQAKGTAKAKKDQRKIGRNQRKKIQKSNKIFTFVFAFARCEWTLVLVKETIYDVNQWLLGQKISQKSSIYPNGSPDV